jgi:hypothetical protein
MNPSAIDPATLPLRDIHLPEPVGWWPPAPGWWLLMLLAVGVIGWSCYQFRRRRMWRLVRDRLKRIEQDFATTENHQRLARDLSALLRQAAITRFGRRRCAGLVGSDWAAFLDATGGGKLFADEFVTAVSEAPYQAQPLFDGEKLISACERWLKSISCQGRRS